MGQITMTTCDHCGRKVENPNEHRGWISLGGTEHILERVHISRATGVFAQGPGECSGFVSDYIDRASDFCGIACLVAALDKKAREREDKKCEAAKKNEEQRSRS
jgi:hypothetical protein